MVKEAIQVGGEYYILASAVAASTPKLALQCDDAFLVTDRRGDIASALRSELGFYFHGTRFLNHWELRLDDEPPVALYWSVLPGERRLVASLTNADLYPHSDKFIPRNTVYVERSQQLCDHSLYEILHIRNFHHQRIHLSLNILFGSDFVDIFEVRGLRRERRGQLLQQEQAAGKVVLAYRGVDQKLRYTRIYLGMPAQQVAEGHLLYLLALEPQDAQTLEFRVTAEIDEISDSGPVVCSASEVQHRLQRRQQEWNRACTSLFSSNELFNEWLNRSAESLFLLTAETPSGWLPYAGVPWYVAPFGRDSALTAYEALLLTSDLARGTLRFLAAHQGRRDDEFQEEEPGKILHEYRTGEMANLREIPFIPYYGSADATPLFLILLDAYVQWTDDRALLEALWPAALAALGWIDGFSERNRDGFADYQRRSAKGLHNQGWRDSWDAVFYGDGRLVEPPVALVEVQGYAYAARQAAARLARLRGEMELAARWEQAAAALRERLNRDFWWPERHTFALALDGQRRMCAVAASSPGHLLWCQAVEPAPAQQVADFLLSEEMFSGWGIRTIGSREARYNPMSYHNGSVWPHDNALIAAGFKNYELQQSLHQLVTALFDASLFFEIAVLPELFCGFPRQPTRKPVAFPVACQPQAWAAACVFLLVQSLLGLTPDAPHQQLLLKNPTLPLWLDWIELRKLRCGNLQVDLRVRRVEAGCAIEVLQKEGQGEIVVTH